ncbi:shikimate kinase [Roseivivax sp. CAU 1753]
MAETAALKGNRLRKSVVLVGMMGAGKTAVGRALAHMLRVPFLDSDAEIERAAAMTIAEIFARDGETFFRRRESEVIARLLGGRPAILSTGGGAFLQEANRRMISEQGVSVWIDADLKLLWNRVKHKTTRPLLRTDDPYRTLSEIYAARVPVYRLADLTVRSEPQYSIEDTARRILETLSARPDVIGDTP